MKWFVAGEKGMRLDIKEWSDALQDVEDLDRMIALGKRVYANAMRTASVKMERKFDGTIMAFAHVLHHMLDEMDQEMWSDLRWSLEEQWKFAERGLWESPDPILKAHAALDKSEDVALLELQQMGHDLLQVVRPNIMRLVWAMTVSSGRKVELHGLEAADPSGSSLLVPLALLDRLMAGGTPDFLDEEEAAGLWELTMAIDIASIDGVTLDELSRCETEREYRFEDGKVKLDLYLHSVGGVPFTMKTVGTWRTNLVPVLCLLIAFKVMFLASVTGGSGALYSDQTSPA